MKNPNKLFAVLLVGAALAFPVSAGEPTFADTLRPAREAAKILSIPMALPNAIAEQGAELLIPQLSLTEFSVGGCDFTAANAFASLTKAAGIAGLAVADDGLNDKDSYASFGISVLIDYLYCRKTTSTAAVVGFGEAVEVSHADDYYHTHDSDSPYTTPDGNDIYFRGYYKSQTCIQAAPGIVKCYGG